jgi:hypothetical protein
MTLLDTENKDEAALFDGHLSQWIVMGQESLIFAGHDVH